MNWSLCDWCREPHGKSAGELNRAKSIGASVYCNRACAGMARRQFRPIDEKKAAKKAYDAEYRKRDPEAMKARKKAYFQRTYDPKKAAIKRKKRMQHHVEYCRQPEYKAWKREYDQQYRAREYGPFSEAYMLAVNLNREIKSRASRHEIYFQNQIGNKKQTRSRSGSEASRERRNPKA